MQWIFPELTPQTAVLKLNEIATAYRKYGIVILPGFFNKEPDFECYVETIRYLFVKLLSRYNIQSKEKDIGDLLMELQKVAPLDGKIITDLGTQHNKFIAANRLKYSNFIVCFLRQIFGKAAILATPQSGDTLHFFLPGKKFKKYNLPIHQDYPYLMQSRQQVTLHFGLSMFYDDVGGIYYWPQTNRLGVLPSKKKKNGSYKIADPSIITKRYKRYELFLKQGDVSFFDSLLCHQSIPNRTKNRARINQIIRFSNLNDELAADNNWYSSVYERRGILFEQAHKDLFVQEE